MPFNKQQQDALDAPYTSDVLISAGAGSGKTKTLTEKVFKLVDEGHIRPSELLVLTFTNNAAHEMKERIIKRFGNESQNSKEMLSSHVQTMDSFNQYLITKYSARLGISSSISVADESIIKSKKNKLLDEILDEYYNSDTKRQIILDYLTHNNLRDDSELKNNVLTVYKNLEALLPNDKIKFFEDYKDIFLSKDKIKESYDKLCNSIKDEMIACLYEAYFIACHYNSFYDENKNINYADKKVIHEIFNNTKFFEKDYNYLDFDERLKHSNEYYSCVLNIINTPNESFFGALKKVYAFTHRTGAGEIKYIDNIVVKTMKGNLFKSKGTFEFIKNFPDTFEEHYDLVLASEKDIELILELTKELDEKLNDYKRTTNFFTFNDIAIMALSLITDPKYEDIADEIRTRFRFIMVDEYQDTNDFQETFINALLVPSKKYGEAHLFCVGDAKQAIYAFRNSNVELFRNRQREYEESKDDNKKVIHMNNNYRSTEILLHDINYIFKSYMTLENGNIDYKDIKEQLVYDDEVNIYKGFNKGCGIYRLVPETYRFNKEDERTIEVNTIIKDIKDKIASGFLVYDRDEKGENKIRPCRYSDFAILLRRKKSFKIYQSQFNKNDLPLNNKVGASLREVDSVIVIETLCNLLEWKASNDSKCDIKHLFASLARSYLFRYDDNELFELLEKPVSEVLKDPIMVKVDDFYRKNKDLSFKEIYLNLLSEFGIVKNLYLVGNIDDNIAKIESLYNLILTTAKAGEGLAEFVRLFKDLKKYNLDIEDETVSNTSNAVNLMTIHASKGLERKIVYMPSSENKLAKGSNKGDLDFMSSYGISMPHYDFTNLDESKIAYNFLHYYYKNSDATHIDEDEHVRLLYVALTRAENSIILVGSDTSKKDSVYSIFKNSPQFRFLNEEILDIFSKPYKVSEDELESYKKLCNPLNKAKVEIAESIKANYLEWFKCGLDGLISSEEVERYRMLKSISYEDTYEINKDMFDDFEVNGRYVDLYDIYNRTFDLFHKDKALEALYFLEKIICAKIVYFYLSYLYVLCNTKGKEDKVIDVFRILSSVKDEIKFSDLSDKDKCYKILEKIESNRTLDLDDLTDEDEEKDDKNEETTETDSLEDYKIVSLDIRDVLSSEDYMEEIKKQVSGLLNNCMTFVDKILSYKETDEAKNANDYFHDLLSKLVYSFDNIKILEKVTYSSDDYEDKVTYYSSDDVISDVAQTVPSLERIDESKIDDSEIEFEVKVKKRASKLKLVDDDLDLEAILKRGVKLHRYLELMDFTTFDTSFIKDDKDRLLIERVLSTPLMQELKGARVYKEYGYYDTEFDTTGFIDLLFVKDDIYTIVDYKTSNIYDEAYEGQLKTYRRNVMRNFGIDESKVRMYLLSLEKCLVKEVK